MLFLQYPSFFLLQKMKKIFKIELLRKTGTNFFQVIPFCLNLGKKLQYLFGCLFCLHPQKWLLGSSSSPQIFCHSFFLGRLFFFMETIWCNRDCSKKLLFSAVFETRSDYVTPAALNSLCTPGCPWNHSNPPASGSPIVGITSLCHHTLLWYLASLGG